jgi:FkbM family methyltransferase
MSFTPLKQVIRRGIRRSATAFGGTKLGRAVFEQIIDTSMPRTVSVSHGSATLMFSVPNSLNWFRTATFSTKEPETLAWIDSIPRGSVLWDVGANVGLYSCYAAKARGCRVFAFEPSVFNLELLARNVFINALTDEIAIVSLPLFECMAESTLKMTSTQWGGALSTFGATFGFDGKDIDEVFEFRTVGLSMDDSVSKLNLPYPDYIKMDVDGIEHLILRGGAAVLARVRGISIEINEAFENQARESQQLLEAAGLRFMSKAHSAMIEANPTFKRTFNQLWVR